ncbi:hypothetical protein SAMN04487983_103125 [Streptomyces sp. yr375]|nr:hypothetical protein SAMN04487983_103125 [Streptomyces sp. yr375]
MTSHESGSPTHGSYAHGSPTHGSYAHGTSGTALLGDTIGANLVRVVATWPDRDALVDVPSGRR